jgi:hypothetical protein
MTVTSSPRAPLARTTLIKVGVRIAVIITLSTCFSYLHMLRTLRTAALTQLEQYVVERGQREEAIFLLAQDNHAVLKKALEERIRALSPEDVSARFERLFVLLPDGTVRNRAEGFDGTKMPGLFVPRGVSLDADVRRRILASYDVLAQYGPAFHTRFTDTYVTLPEGPLILYWPERPTWCLEAEPGFAVVDLPLFPISRPENNPERKTAWSEVFVDTVAHSSMATVTTPLDLDGRHVATVSHDVLLEQMVSRASGDHLPGAYNVIFRDDGQLIAHPELRDSTRVYNILGTPAQPEEATALPGTAEQRAHLRDIFERVRDREPGQRVLELPGHHEYVAVGRLQGPGWNFVTVLSDDMVSRPASQAAHFIPSWTPRATTSWGSSPAPSGTWPTRSSTGSRPCAKPTRASRSASRSAPASSRTSICNWCRPHGAPAWRRSPPTCCTTWATCSTASTPRPSSPRSAWWRCVWSRWAAWPTSSMSTRPTPAPSSPRTSAGRTSCPS